MKARRGRGGAYTLIYIAHAVEEGVSQNFWKSDAGLGIRVEHGAQQVVRLQESTPEAQQRKWLPFTCVMMKVRESKGVRQPPAGCRIRPEWTEDTRGWWLMVKKKQLSTGERRRERRCKSSSTFFVVRLNVGGAEGKSSPQENIQNHAERPDVGRWTFVGLAIQNFCTSTVWLSATKVHPEQEGAAEEEGGTHQGQRRPHFPKTARAAGQAAPPRRSQSRSPSPNKTGRWPARTVRKQCQSHTSRTPEMN